MQLGIASSTARSYRSAQNRYTDFCRKLGLTPVPATEQVLILFVAELAQSVAHATIRSYLSAVRNLHITKGWPDPLVGTLRLELVLKGVKRVKASPAKIKLPITPLILYRIREGIRQQGDDEDGFMLWAACCLGFFGFLRTAEFTVPNGKDFDPSVHLTAGDITVDSHIEPSLLQVRIKASKTDQFKQGTALYLAATRNDLCPVAAILSYLARRPNGEGPLFVSKAGDPLTRLKFVTKLRQVLQQVGIQADQYTGHSFRIGAATTAAAKGIPDNMIKALGWWTSEAYQVYIKLPRERLASITQTISQ